MQERRVLREENSRHTAILTDNPYYKWFFSLSAICVAEPPLVPSAGHRGLTAVRQPVAPHPLLLLPPLPLVVVVVAIGTRRVDAVVTVGAGRLRPRAQDLHVRVKDLFESLQEILVDQARLTLSVYLSKMKATFSTAYLSSMQNG